MANPNGPPLLRTFSALALCSLVGCATNSDPAAPSARGQATASAAADPLDEPRTGEISFPRPDRESCSPRSRTPYRLSVRVRDDTGSAFPGVAVHLFPMGAGNERLATTRTNSSGAAEMVVNPPGVYAVSVATGGFEPQIRPLTMRAGCSGSTTFVLKPGPVAK